METRSSLRPRKSESTRHSSNKARKSRTKKQLNSYEVERILDFKIRNGKYLYLVKWKNFSDNHITWQPESNFNTLPPLQRRLEKKKQGIIKMLESRKRNKEERKKGVRKPSQEGKKEQQDQLQYLYSRKRIQRKEYSTKKEENSYLVNLFTLQEDDEFSHKKRDEIKEVRQIGWQKRRGIMCTVSTQAQKERAIPIEEVKQKAPMKLLEKFMEMAHIYVDKKLKEFKY